MSLISTFPSTILFFTQVFLLLLENFNTFDTPPGRSGWRPCPPWCYCAHAEWETAPCWSSPYPTVQGVKCTMLQDNALSHQWRGWNSVAHIVTFKQTAPSHPLTSDPFSVLYKGTNVFIDKEKLLRCSWLKITGETHASELAIQLYELCMRWNRFKNQPMLGCQKQSPKPVTYDTRRPASSLYRHLSTDLHLFWLGSDQTKDILYHFYFSSEGFIVHFKCLTAYQLCQRKHTD